MAEVATKRCRCCQQELPREVFMSRPSNRDGLYSYCRKCNSAKVKESLASRPGWKEHKREYDRARNERLKEALTEYRKDYYLRNRERKLAYSREWAAKNPDLRRTISQNYKHRRRMAESSGMSGRELAKWKREQPKVCHWCGAKCAKHYHVDHYVPLSKGGRHQADNLVIACGPCNLRKSAKDPFDFAKEVGRLL